MNCEMCDIRPATDYDADLEMWLCAYDYASLNGTIVDIELDEVF
jgi:hypothetical protein